MTRYFSIVILISLFTLSGCATLIHGRRQDVTITSAQAGAQVEIDYLFCDTPCRLNVRRKAEYITVRQNGCTKQFEVVKDRNLGATLLGNIPFYYLGIPIDVMTGAIYDIKPIHIPSIDAGTCTIPTAASTGFNEASERGGASPREDQPYSTPLAYSLPYVPEAAPRFHHALTINMADQIPNQSRIARVAVGYEDILSGDMTWYANLGYGDYRGEDSHYRDDARGFIWEIGARKYLRRSVLRGFFFGGGIGGRNMHGSWTDDFGTPFETSGNGDVSSVEFLFQIGHKTFIHDDRIFIEPSMKLGLASTDSRPKYFSEEFGFLHLGLAVGAIW